MNEEMLTVFNAARLYGKVNLFTSDNGTYSAGIKFATLAHITLEAHSGYNHICPVKCLRAAIENAELICQSVEQIKERKLIK